MKKYDYRLNKPRDIRKFLARIANDLKNGAIKPSVANAISYTCNVLMKSQELSDISTRLDDLEKLILARRENKNVNSEKNREN